MAKLLKEEYGLDPNLTYPPELKITMMPIEDLVLGNRRTRRRSPKASKKVRASVHRFGMVRPLLVTQSGSLIDGHELVEAAKELGLKEVAVIIISHLNAAEVKALSIALNKTQELGQWNLDVLQDELSFILEFDCDFDLSVTGFETPELDIILDNDEDDAQHPDPADELPDNESTEVVSRYGDRFSLGDHFLLCGDATKAEDLSRLMDGQIADIAFTDHPYNLAARSIGGLGKVQHADFKMAAGEMSVEEFEQFLRTSIELIIEYSRTGAVMYFCIDWRSVELMLKVGRELGLTLLNICVWTKDNGGMGSFYRSKHELICVFRKGNVSHINNVELGRFGRYRTNHWEYAGFNSFTKDRDALLAAHPTVKPVALVSDAIKDASNRQGIVLDPFAGSGTTLIAAQKTGRRAYCLELDAKYVDVIIMRFEAQFGIEAVHVETGLRYSELAELRRNEQVKDDVIAPIKSPGRIRTRKSSASKGGA